MVRSEAAERKSLPYFDGNLLEQCIELGLLEVLERRLDQGFL